MTLICIVGAGIIGLASATLLRDAGYDVVVVARDLPGDPGGLPWASPSAGAAILLQPDAADPQMQADSFQYYWALAHTQPASGVMVVTATEYFDGVAADAPMPWYRAVLPHFRRLAAAELPAGVGAGAEMTTCAVNPAVVLPWLRGRLAARGVRFERGVVDSLEEVRSRTGAAVVVNATGLGAAALVGDARLHPVRGQTLLVRGPAAEAWGTRVVLRDGGGGAGVYAYAIPRMFSGGGVVLGGCREPGSRATAVDAGRRVAILREINALTDNAFASVDPEDGRLTADGLPMVEDIVGFRPALAGADFRLEAEGGHTVHAYGFGGAGYVHSFGAAKRVVALVEGMGVMKSKL